MSYGRGLNSLDLLFLDLGRVDIFLGLPLPSDHLRGDRGSSGGRSGGCGSGSDNDLHLGLLLLGGRNGDRRRNGTDGSGGAGSSRSRHS